MVERWTNLSSSTLGLYTTVAWLRLRCIPKPPASSTSTIQFRDGISAPELVGRTRDLRNSRIKIDRSITLASTASIMGTAQSRTAQTAQSRPQLPEIRFRVLVIGRANAGKTSILQRVCETTKSPTIYRGGREVRRPSLSFITWVLLSIGHT